MTAPEVYGTLRSEKRASENAACREIVRQVLDYGVSQHQLLMLVYLFASNLEDIEKMQRITSLARELGAGTFITNVDEELIDVPEGANSGS